MEHGEKAGSKSSASSSHEHNEPHSNSDDEADNHANQSAGSLPHGYVVYPDTCSKIILTDAKLQGKEVFMIAHKFCIKHTYSYLAMSIAQITTDD